jgi:hypothetical protein
MLSRAKIGVLMTIGFLLAIPLILTAFVIGVLAIEPICNVIDMLAGRP